MELISREAAIADRIEKQVKATRGVMKSCGIDKGDLETLELLTAHFLDMAADLRALPAQAPAVKVRALEWEGFASGSYRIEVEKGGIAILLYYSAAIYNDEEPEQILGGYLSLVSMNDLKAAAQADHEARILAALDLS